ncbi:hypothetical protein [Marinobacterium sedimentorum]|uniref:hypothetical protein n=1 Tax=Marinobacterium sedimentorum TaxID=2927804 RepID=UPI0020C5D8BE|nr:hypothetical protein [Marinobacterium sedimentorum]MCP8687379.1 hypothetical protein [Marinobacterium sedimentorum]
MLDERTMRDFGARDEDEQQAFLTQTWCDNCQQANLGMHTVIEYELKGVLFIEGKCAGCGEPVLTELTDDDF